MSKITTLAACVVAFGAAFFTTNVLSTRTLTAAGLAVTCETMTAAVAVGAMDKASRHKAIESFTAAGGHYSGNDTMLTRARAEACQ